MQSILERFWHINKDKRIKPFNFIIVGIGHRLDQITKEPIIPMIPYTKNYDVVPYTPFIDYKTSKEYKDNTKFYWKPLSEFLFAYFEHNDNKYEGTLGELKRRHIEIGGIEHIGKESNNLLVLKLLDKPCPKRFLSNVFFKFSTVRLLYISITRLIRIGGSSNQTPIAKRGNAVVLTK